MGYSKKRHTRSIRQLIRSRLRRYSLLLMTTRTATYSGHTATARVATAQLRLRHSIRPLPSIHRRNSRRQSLHRNNRALTRPALYKGAMYACMDHSPVKNFGPPQAWHRHVCRPKRPRRRRLLRIPQHLRHANIHTRQRPKQTNSRSTTRSNQPRPKPRNQRNSHRHLRRHTARTTSSTIPQWRTMCL
jgi:hypothetical protein